MDTASSLGFRAAAWTFLTQPAVTSPTFTPAWGKCGKTVPETEEAVSQIRVRWRRAAESPKKPDVPDPARADRQPLSLPRQRPDPGTAAVSHARRRRDAPGRPPLCHRKRPQRLRSCRPEMDVEGLFPDADAGRMAGGGGYPFRRCDQSSC